MRRARMAEAADKQARETEFLQKAYPVNPS